MIKSCCTYVFIFIATLSVGQNLVPNPSFENYSLCPDAGGQIGYATPWYSVPSDNIEYYNACNLDSTYSVPTFGLGSYQDARTGAGMVGLWMYNGVGLNYREYLRCDLSGSLISGECYEVSFHVNLQNTTKYAVNNFGLYFSNTDITDTGTGNVLNLNPHIMKFNNVLIDDTLNWTTIIGVYLADGSENYLTIGNFFNDSNTDTLDTENGTYPGAYYFIDDVSVIPVDSLVGGMPAFAGNDTTIYYGDTLFIGQEIYGLNCNWYDANNTQIATNISGINVWPDTNTFYVVEQTLCSSISYDTIYVTVDTSNIGLFQQPQTDFQLYPNPAENVIHIESGNPSHQISVDIVSASGKLVYSQELTSLNGVYTFEPDLSRGVYFVTILDTNSEQSEVKRLVIQ